MNVVAYWNEWFTTFTNYPFTFYMVLSLDSHYCAIKSWGYVKLVVLQIVEAFVVTNLRFLQKLEKLQNFVLCLAVLWFDGAPNLLAQPFLIDRWTKSQKGFYFFLYYQIKLQKFENYWVSKWKNYI